MDWGMRILSGRLVFIVEPVFIAYNDIYAG